MRSSTGGFGFHGGLFVPKGRYGSDVIRDVLILEHGRNPSTDYYIRPRFTGGQGICCRVIDIASTDPSQVDIPSGALVVLVRYASRRWLRRLSADRNRLAGVIYFMDDDLPAAMRGPGLPFRYRYKILTLFLLQRGFLSELCSEVWVSTGYLAAKYGLGSSAVKEPLPLAASPAGEQRLTYFYEGTASHALEFRWLREVVLRVQHRVPSLTFITIGGPEIRRIFAGIPGTLCIHPLSWPDYVQSLPMVRHDIGLAPMFDTSFNKARSHTKFFDITRLGGVGVYSNIAPYADFVRTRQDGLLVANEPDAWCDAICELASSEPLREELRANAEARVGDLRQSSAPHARRGSNGLPLG